MNTPKFTLNGYWNGEPATFTAFTYKVKKQDEIPLHWQNSNEDDIRQAIEITYCGRKFAIDNKFGDGYHKVTEGLGSPRCGHKSVDLNSTCKTYISKEELVMDFDSYGLLQEEAKHDIFCMENNPEEYKKMVALRNAILRR